MNHIMIDLETLGTTSDACIISFGAAKFDLESDKIDDEGFYASISLKSNLDMGRRINEDTLIWWMKQGLDAQRVFHEPKIALPDALQDFADWVGDPKKYTMWSNGADFDLPMVAHALTQCDIPIPWIFWNSRCVRTYKNLPGAKKVCTPPAGVKHNALSDAVQQIMTVQAIHKALFTKAK